MKTKPLSEIEKAVEKFVSVDCTVVAAFAAMDEAASEFWAYPGEEWQQQFLRDWANNHLTAARKNILVRLLGL